jgi:phage N-6-adenine-methyltransferase
VSTPIRRVRLKTNKTMNVHFSSKTDLWETPQEFFDAINSEFAFEIDVCALPENAKCARYFTPEQNGLHQEWRGVCWMNPPYGREIGKWIRKAAESAQAGAKVVCLIPSRTDTAWWHDYIEGRAEVRFIRGRLKFGGAKNSAPFPSAVVIFHGSSSEVPA